MIDGLGRKLVFLFLFMLGALGVGQTAIAADNQLTGMRLGMIDLNGAPALRIVIETRQPATAKLLLLDEPTEGIQPSIILDIERAVQRIIKETGISVLLVEQHLHFVRQSNFYYAMQRGGIVSSGPTSSLSEAVIQEFLTV